MFVRQFLAAILISSGAVRVASQVQAAPVPAEMRSSFFAVTVDGQRVDTAFAASSYEFVNFSVSGPAEVSVTAAEPGFWDHGVDIEPWRLGLRATRAKGDAQTIRFRLSGPAKIAISRPGDFLNHARMLFLFADTPAPQPPTGPNVTVVSVGVHRGSLNPKSGDTVYLTPGAYVFGSLNLWNVDNVKVLGRGVIVYDGPQDPADDDGWMQRKDWHCIGAYQSHNVQIDGVTCIVRSRTWSIQMKDSTGFRYNDLRVIGGNPGNANQDGMDWLGGGDTIVRNSFFRASDDDLAMEGNWDGYTQDDMVRPGQDINDIVVEDSELSTSISNIVRINWPQKSFNSRNFTLRNSDILHAGIGACGQTFGLLGFWGASGAKGNHSGINFENIFLDNWYSLAQVEQEQPAVHGIAFRNIWALGQPPLADSTLAGDVHDVTVDNLKYEQQRATTDAEIPLAVTAGAEQPKFAAAPVLTAAFRVDPANARVHQKLTFTAQGMPAAEYTWLFGDGTVAHGRRARHRFADALGTELDGANGAGVFRVLLHVTDKAGHQDWAEQNLAVTDRFHEPIKDLGKTAPGLAWKIYNGSWAELPDFTKLTPVFTGASPNLEANAQGFTRWATVWNGFVNVPADGGYIFHLIDRDGARLMIDGVEVAKTGPPFAQVCGSPGNALRYDRGAIGLQAGLHSIHIEALNTMSGDAPRVLWEGPGMTLGEIPAQDFVQAIH